MDPASQWQKPGPRSAPAGASSRHQVTVPKARLRGLVGGPRHVSHGSQRPEWKHTRTHARTHTRTCTHGVGRDLAAAVRHTSFWGPTRDDCDIYRWIPADEVIVHTPGRVMRAVSVDPALRLCLTGPDFEESLCENMCGEGEEVHADFFRAVLRRGVE